MDLLNRSAAQMADGIRFGLFSGVQLIEASLARAAEVQAELNAFTIIDNTGALLAASNVDRMVAEGKPLPSLAGVPIVIKDLTPTKGMPTTLGSLTTGDGETHEDAIIVQRLRQAGSIIVAKSTTSEFAYSSFTRSKRFGITRNPWNVNRTPGGSSGGSAVAVATRVVPFAEGTDMGGSIRSPAAACGVVGFKPSLGRIPMTILPTPIDTISHFGPLAYSVEDAVAFVATTSGPSDLDLLSQMTPFQIGKCKLVGLKGLRFAFSLDLGYCAVSSDVEVVIRDAVARVREQGAIVDEIDIRWTRDVMDQWLLKWAAFLGLFPSGRPLESRKLMDPALARLIERGEVVTAASLKRTELLQSGMASDMAQIFGRYDAFLCPTNAITAPVAEASDSDFEGTVADGYMRAFDMTHPFNLVPTYPVISLPVGLAADGLPVGIQVVGRRYGDERLLSLAAGMEKIFARCPLSWTGASNLTT